MSVNKQILIGNVGRKPEVRTFDDGNKLVTFSLATTERWKDKKGQQQELTQWHNVTVKNSRIAETVERYVDKGSKLYVEGKLITRKYPKKDGTEGLSVETVVGPFSGEITFLGESSKNTRSDAGHGQFASGNSQGQFPAAAAQAPQNTVNEDLNDEIPF